MKGWRNEPFRHSLASRGIRTSHSKLREEIDASDTTFVPFDDEEDMKKLIQNSIDYNMYLKPEDFDEVLISLLHKSKEDMGINEDIYISSRVYDMFGSEYPSGVTHIYEDGYANMKINVDFYDMMFREDIDKAFEHLKFTIYHELAHYKQFEELGYSEYSKNELDDELERKADKVAESMTDLSKDEYERLEDEILFGEEFEEE